VSPGWGICLAWFVSGMVVSSVIWWMMFEVIFRGRTDVLRQKLAEADDDRRLLAGCWSADVRRRMKGGGSS